MYGSTMGFSEEVEVEIGPEDDEIIVERPNSEGERLPLPDIGTGPTDPIQVHSVTGPILLKRTDGTVLFESNSDTTDLSIRVRRGGATMEAH